jgi:hypothetical protein
MDEDGLPLDDVGPWAKEKLERLRKYVDISRAARRKFLHGSGGATYIDLFCGSGRSSFATQVKKSTAALSSLLRALEMAKFLFQEFI